jgi:hypothetical protein
VKRNAIIVTACLLLSALPVIAAVTSDDPSARDMAVQTAPGTPGASTKSTAATTTPDPELAVLRARADACIARGDRGGAKVYESQIQGILYRRQPQPPVELVVTPLPDPPAGLDAPPDVVISPGPVLSLATDYESDGTMWAAAGLTDSSVRVWNSTDHGATWNYITGATISPYSVFDRIGLAVGIGDSNFIHLLLIHPNGNGDAYEVRWNHDGTGTLLFPVLVGADTLVDLTFCRDNVSPYYLYAVVREELHSVSEQNGWVVRSTAFGTNWAVTDAFYNLGTGSIQAGPGSWIYYSVAPQVPEGRGQLNLLWNKTYGSPGAWLETNPRPDTFDIDEPVMTPAYTMPESTAVAWVAYHHNGVSTSYDVLALHSTDGCQTWSAPATIAGSANMEVWPDLKHYRSVGNTYVNVSYIDYDMGANRRVLYRQWSDAANPGTWHDPTVLSDTQPFRSHQLKPSLVYSPGAPGSGAGCVFADLPSTRLLWNAPWMATSPLSPDSLYFKALSGTALMCAAKSANPAPYNRVAMSFQDGQSVPCMDPQGNYVYEVIGSTLRRFSTTTGAYTDFPLSNAGIRTCATDGNFVFVPNGTSVHKYTTTGTYVNTTTLNITCDAYSFALANDTVWASPDRYNHVFYGYASTRFQGGSISQDQIWDVGTGIYGTGNIAFDGTYYYVTWIGTNPITFKRFTAARTLYDAGLVSIDPRSVMCLWTSHVAVEELTGASPVGLSMSIAPNPLASGAATLRYLLPASGPACVTIYDVTGRLAYRRVALVGPAGAVSLELHDLAGGVYVVRLDAGTRSIAQKLVVQR